MTQVQHPFKGTVDLLAGPMAVAMPYLNLNEMTKPPEGQIHGTYSIPISDHDMTAKVVFPGLTPKTRVEFVVPEMDTSGDEKKNRVVMKFIGTPNGDSVTEYKYGWKNAGSISDFGPFVAALQETWAKEWKQISTVKGVGGVDDRARRRTLDRVFTPHIEAIVSRAQKEFNRTVTFSQIFSEYKHNEGHKSRDTHCWARVVVRKGISLIISLAPDHPVRITDSASIRIDVKSVGVLNLHEFCDLMKVLVIAKEMPTSASPNKK